MRQRTGPAALAGLAMALDLSAALAALGALRGLISHGTLLMRRAEMMFGAGSKWLTLPMFPEYEASCWPSCVPEP